MVTSLALDAQQNLWMGMCSAHTTAGGVARFDGEDWWVFNEWNSGLPHVTATGLAFDEQGNAWIGTYGGGLAVFRPQSVVDFNGDGIVDTKDLLRLIESWGQADPLCDIGPTAFGDGIVDAADLEVLMSNWMQAVDDPTLLAHWALDEAEGTVAFDSAGQNDGQVIGAALWQPDGGVLGGALDFDGATFVVGDYVLNPYHGPFSVIAWIKGGAPGQVIVSQQGGANWLMADALDGSLMTDLRAGGRSPVSLGSEAVIADGNWHRIAFTWDGVNRRLYVGDELVSEDAQDALGGSVGNQLIASGANMSAGTFWVGLIDDVRIYNRAVKP
jgi:hypothetical protein